MPSAYLIDTDGTALGIHHGYRPGDLNEVLARIEAALGPNDTTGATLSE